MIETLMLSLLSKLVWWSVERLFLANDRYESHCSLCQYQFVNNGGRQSPVRKGLCCECVIDLELLTGKRK